MYLRSMLNIDEFEFSEEHINYNHFQSAISTTLLKLSSVNEENSYTNDNFYEESTNVSKEELNIRDGLY